MSNPETVLTWLLYLFWMWRVCTFLYSSYSISDVMTPSCASGRVKSYVMFSVMASCVLLQLVPTAQFPRVSLAKRIISIPSQGYSLYFAHRYIGRTLASQRVTIFLYVVTVLSILETLYMIKSDWNRIE